MNDNDKICNHLLALHMRKIIPSSIFESSILNSLN